MILGAADFRSSKFPRNDAFARSATAFTAYLRDPSGLAVEDARILDLFGSAKLPAEQLLAVSEHLERHRASSSDLIIYYVGHGGFLKNRDYFLAVSATGDRDEFATALEVEKLGLAVGEHFRRRRIFVILDCCFAGHAAQVFFQSGELELAQRRARASFPTAGTALLAAASKEDAATVEPGEAYSTFTKYFMRVLREGVPNAPRLCSLYDIGDRIRELIEVDGVRTSRPQVHAPEQHDGDVALYPLFPNPQGDREASVPTAPRGRRANWIVAAGLGALLAGVAIALAVSYAQFPTSAPQDAMPASSLAPPSSVDAAVDAAVARSLPDNPWRPIPGRPAEMLTYEVTREEFVPYLKSVNATTAPWGGLVLADEERRLPVTMVSWKAAHDFCLTIGGRLPSVTEWEAAAAPWHKLSIPSCLSPRAVGTSGEPPSKGGFQDILSNAYEWAGPLNARRAAQRVGVDCLAPANVMNQEVARARKPEVGWEWRPERGEDTIGFRCARDRTRDEP